MPSLTINDAVKLSSGASMPRLAAYDSASAALKAGYRHIDSAQLYRNEGEMGNALRDSGVPRSQVFMTTKILRPPSSGQSYAQSLQRSVDTIGHDYVDLFLIHAPDNGQKVRKEMWEALVRFQKDGKAKDIGVSNYGVKHLEEMAKYSKVKPAVNQIELHPFAQQKPIVEYCQREGIVLQAYCPLMQAQRFDNATLVKVAESNGKSVAQVLIRWSLQKGYVPLPKSDTPERIVANADVFDFELSSADMEALDLLDLGDEGVVSWNPIYAA